MGEYGIGDDVLAVPSFSFMQMRTFTDPARDYGDDMKAFDVDVQVIGFSIPFVLPDDFTLTFGHSYVAPSTFRGKKSVDFLFKYTKCCIRKKYCTQFRGCHLFVRGCKLYFFSGGFFARSNY